MISDFRSLEDGRTVEADLCVIGGGSAGISLAQEFIGTGVSVCLVESGGFEFEPETQALYEGEMDGADPHELETMRLRFFGGTSNHWQGFCMPFNAIDFEKRAWVPYSGWPIDLDSLTPFYRRAQKVLRLGPFSYDEDRGRELDLDIPAFDKRKIYTRFWQWPEPLRFGEAYRESLRQAKNVHVLLHANAVDLKMDRTGATVRHVEIRSLSGKAARVRARGYVLACGGLEIPRLMLASNKVEANGVGNRYDQVGRYFLGHPHELEGGLIVTDDLDLLPNRDLRLDRIRHKIGFCIAAQMQRKEAILNGLTYLDIVDAAAAGAGPMDPPIVSHIYVVFEQTPNPENRVTLISDRDALGMSRIHLNWRLGELDKRTAEVVVRTAAAEFSRLGLGRVKLLDWLLEPGEFSGLQLGGHHIGTTRMGDDPKTSVVDRDCRVHAMENLYVAGPSVFPTSSYANPTLTLVALTLRLADHLKAKLI